MANSPLLNARVTITCKDNSGNSVLKTFNSVRYMTFDYNDATLNIVDLSGSFYFPITPLATLTYTIVTGATGQHTVVMS